MEYKQEQVLIWSVWAVEHIRPSDSWNIPTQKQLMCSHVNTLNKIKINRLSTNQLINVQLAIDKTLQIPRLQTRLTHILS